jgi:hypothetical protein
VLDAELVCDQANCNYVLVVEGAGSAEGSYSVTMTCNSLDDIEGAIACGNVVTGSTVGAANSVSSSGSHGGDHMYSFSVSEPTDIQFNSCLSNYDTFLRIFSTELAEELHSCDDCGDCGTRSVLDAALDAGDYILLVEGYAGVEGEYSVQMICETDGLGFHDGDIICDQTVRGNTAVAPGAAGLSQAHSYSFTLPDGANIVQFDACDSNFDTILRIMDASLTSELESCDDCGPCGTRTVLDAELVCDRGGADCSYALVIEGYGGQRGHYAITMGCSREDEDIVGSVDCGSTIVGTTVGAATSIGIEGGDHLYSFTVDYARLVQFDSCASSYDTALRIMSSQLDNELSSCDDCSGLCDGRAVLDADMMPGDYILVVGGARGSCQCSGVTNTIGEGDDCHDFDLGIGAWCYTAPGACDDGQPSGRMPNTEYSYDACRPQAQEEGEYSITMNCPGETGFLDGTIHCGETVTGTTRLATSHVGTGAGDHIFAFTCDTDNPSNQCDITFDSCESSFDTYLRIYSEDMSEEITGCDDCGSCGTRSILSNVVLNKGNYHLIVEGFSFSEGSYSVFMECADVDIEVCTCSGQSNTAGEGSDCLDFDGDQGWCYTDHGVCDDGAPSSSVDADWSYSACDHMVPPPPPPPPIRGCMIPVALNYNPIATEAVESECIIHAPPPPPAVQAGDAEYDFCFGTSSASSFIETFDYGSPCSAGAGGVMRCAEGRWTHVDDEYLTEPGNWIFINGVATETTDAYGNNPGDDAIMGTYLMLDGIYDQFILEVEVVNNDNDGVGFLFGYQDVIDHFTATEINDVWPSPAADGYSGPAMKIRRRDGQSAPNLNSYTSPFSLLDSEDGDDGVSVNKRGYSPYFTAPAVSTMALKVECCDSQANYIVTFQSTRGARAPESVTGYTDTYLPGQIGLFVYSHTAEFDNLRITPLGPGSEVIQRDTIGPCTGGGRPPPPPPPPPSGSLVTPSTDVLAASVDTSHATYQLRVTLGGEARNIYTIFGDADGALALPAVYQVAPPFGVDVGGVNPGLFAIMPASQYDSWLTVGATDGSERQLSSVGLDFTSWSDATDLSCTNCAVFLMDPDSGPTTSAVVAQLTLARGTSSVVTMGLQGRSTAATLGSDWASRTTFSVGGAPPLAPPPSPPPPRPHRHRHRRQPQHRRRHPPHRGLRPSKSCQPVASRA